MGFCTFISNQLKMSKPDVSPLVNIEKVEMGGTYHNHFDDTEINHKLSRIYRAVINDTAAEEALSDYIDILEKQLRDVLSGDVLPPAVQEKVDAIFNASEADKTKLQDAILANTPQE
jgi:hypothetical protein